MLHTGTDVCVVARWRTNVAPMEDGAWVIRASLNEGGLPNPLPVGYEGAIDMECAPEGIVSTDPCAVAWTAYMGICCAETAEKDWPAGISVAVIG